MVIKRFKFITPNLLTILSFLLRALSAYYIIKQTIVPVAITAFIAHLLDWADGMLARETNQSSKIGAVLDPLADRFGATIQLSALAYVLLTTNQLISSAIVFLILILFLNELGLYELCSNLQDKQEKYKEEPYKFRIKQMSNIFGKSIINKISKMINLAQKHRVNLIPSYIETYYTLFILGPFLAYNQTLVIVALLLYLPQFIFSLLRLYLATKSK